MRKRLPRVSSVERRHSDQLPSARDVRRRICIIGCGYVGLVTASGFASLGHTVVGVERNAPRLAALRSGQMPFYEPGLQEQVEENMARGRLSFASDCDLDGSGVEFIFLATDTPVDEAGKVDLSDFWQAAAILPRAISGRPPIVVIKSTVPLGTARALGDFFGRLTNGGHGWSVVSSPEFLTEGNALRSFRECDRIVLGSDDPRALKEVESLYAAFGAPLVKTDFATAELIKCGSNAFLAAKISFLNELANLCECAGADVRTLALGMGMDPRIGSAFLRAGVGFGGSCLPKDTRALARMARDHGLELSIVEAAIEANRNQRRAVVQRLHETLVPLSGRCIALWGLAFKPNTADIRGSPALDIIEALQTEGADIRAHDPRANEPMRQRFPSVHYARDPLSAVEGADAVVLLTEWQEFRSLALTDIRAHMRGDVLLDGRYMWEKEEVEQAGLKYLTVAASSRRESQNPGVSRVANRHHFISTIEQ